MNNKTFILHVKFHDVDKGVIAEKVFKCINLFEIEKKGYKLFGHHSTFLTSRFVSAFTDLKKAIVSANEIGELYKDDKSSVTILVYTKENNNIFIERVKGKEDFSILDELKLVDMDDVPKNF